MDKILKRGEFDSEALEKKREKLQKEINANNIEPLSFEVFEKTEKEREDLKKAKSICK